MSTGAQSFCPSLLFKLSLRKVKLKNSSFSLFLFFFLLFSRFIYFNRFILFSLFLIPFLFFISFFFSPFRSFSSLLCLSRSVYILLNHSRSFYLFLAYLFSSSISFNVKKTCWIPGWLICTWSSDVKRRGSPTLLVDCWGTYSILVSEWIDKLINKTMNECMNEWI